MNRRTILGWIWNSLATATIITLLVGMFALALPKVHRATATVYGQSGDMLEIRSTAFLAGVVKESDLDFVGLQRFEDVLLGRRGPEDPVTRLAGNLQLTKGDGENWIDISIDAPDAKLAAAVANEVAKYYLRKVAETDSPELDAAIIARLENAELVLLDYLNENPWMRDLAGKTQEMSRELMSLQTRSTV